MIREPIIQEYAKDQGYKLEMTYKGSVDSMLELQNNPDQYDGIWLPNSMWIHMGDTHNVVKHDKSIFSFLQLSLELNNQKQKYWGLRTKM